MFWVNVETITKWIKDGGASGGVAGKLTADSGASILYIYGEKGDYGWRLGL